MTNAVPTTLDDAEWQFRLKLSNRLQQIEDEPFDVHKLTPTATADLGTGEQGWVKFCTDGDAGSPCLVVHDGSDWKVVSLGATASAT